MLAAILQLAGATYRTPARARVLTGLGAMIWAQGNPSEARTCLEEAASICRECGDERGLAVALEKLVDYCFFDLDVLQPYQFCAEAIALYEKVNDPVGATRMRQWLGLEKYHEGDYSAAQAIFEESMAIYKAQQHEAGLGVALLDLGRALFQQQKFTEANQRFVEALQRARERGDQWLVSNTLYFMGRTAYHQGDYSKAQPLFEESLRIVREIGTRASPIAFAMAFLGDIALVQGDAATAQAMLREGLTLSYQEGQLYTISLILPRCASVAVTFGRHTRAVQLIAAGHSFYLSFKRYLPPNDQVAFDAPLAAVRQFLPAEEYAQAWTAGARMTMAEAVALALAEIVDQPSMSGDNPHA